MQPLRQRRAKRGELVAETWTAAALLDRFGLHPTELHQQSREEVIRRRQEELIEPSTPVIRL
jgi:rsbT co-antagonist protein RsbR